MIAFIVGISIAALFTAGAVLRQQSATAKRLIPCAFCGSVVLTWAWMLVGRWTGVPWLQGTDALLALGILMGGSAVGFPTRLARQWKARGVRGTDLSRALMVFGGFAIVFTLLTGRWGWLALVGLLGGITAAILIPAMRTTPVSDGARASFLERINRCCDEP